MSHFHVIAVRLYTASSSVYDYTNLLHASSSSESFRKKYYVVIEATDARQGAVKRNYIVTLTTEYCSTWTLIIKTSRYFCHTVPIMFDLS